LRRRPQAAAAKSLSPPTRNKGDAKIYICEEKREITVSYESVSEKCDEALVVTKRHAPKVLAPRRSGVAFQWVKTALYFVLCLTTNEFPDRL
jgi:hypothetical protein